MPSHCAARPKCEPFSITQLTSGHMPPAPSGSAYAHAGRVRDPTANGWARGPDRCFTQNQLPSLIAAPCPHTSCEPPTCDMYLEVDVSPC